MAKRRDGQLDLFGGPPPDLAPAPVPPDVAALGAALPARVHLGTSSWSFPGWVGLVWDREVSEAKLAREGLAVYAKHPLLRAVGLDRTFYAPVEAAVLAAYAAAVPEGFRFLVKAHEACTTARFPDHPRYGALRGQDNPRFLDAAYAADAVVRGYVEGLGGKGGALVFQLPPQDVRRLGGADRFAERLAAFLAALPRGPVYAVEVRNAAFLGAPYAAALAAAGACHVYSAHPSLPSLDEQARLVPLAPQPAIVARWMLHRGLDYEGAVARYAPFTRLVDPDPETRLAFVRLLAAEARKPAIVTVNNKAEGSAPLSIQALARALVGSG